MPICYYEVDAKNIKDSFVLWEGHYNRDTCCECLWFIGRYATLKVAKEYGKQFVMDYYLVITRGDKFICERERGERTTDGFEVPKWETIKEHRSFEDCELFFHANCNTNIQKMNVINNEIVSK